RFSRDWSSDVCSSDLLVRVDERLGGVADIRETVVSTREAVPVRIGDVAQVSIGGDLRSGAASLNGEEAVIGTVLMRSGENSRTEIGRASRREGRESTV